MAAPSGCRRVQRPPPLKRCKPCYVDIKCSVGLKGLLQSLPTSVADGNGFGGRASRVVSNNIPATGHHIDASDVSTIIYLLGSRRHPMGVCLLIDTEPGGRLRTPPLGTMLPQGPSLTSQLLLRFFAPVFLQRLYRRHQYGCRRRQVTLTGVSTRHTATANFTAAASYFVVVMSAKYALVTACVVYPV